MRRLVSLFLILFLSLSCTVTFPSNDTAFNDKVATQVAIVRTATALHEMLENQQEETQPAPTDESDTVPEATETPPANDPKSELGQPSWQDDLSTGRNWNLDSGDQDFGNTRFYHQDGYLGATSSSTSSGFIWWLNYLEFKDAYLEARFSVETCSGNDQYGLVFRSVDYESGYAYYFTISCDGHYDIRRWTASGSTLLLESPSSTEIHTGSNQTNTLGVWVKDATIRLYVNGQFLQEVKDSGLSNEGHFGLFINAKQTPGFTIKMDEIAYWLFD